MINRMAHVPPSHEEAISGLDVPMWIRATNFELGSIKRNNAWEVVDATDIMKTPIGLR